MPQRCISTSCPNGETSHDWTCGMREQNRPNCEAIFTLWLHYVELCLQFVYEFLSKKETWWGLKRTPYCSRNVQISRWTPDSWWNHSLIFGSWRENWTKTTGKLVIVELILDCNRWWEFANLDLLELLSNLSCMKINPQREPTCWFLQNFLPSLLPFTSRYSVIDCVTEEVHLGKFDCMRWDLEIGCIITWRESWSDSEEKKKVQNGLNSELRRSVSCEFWAQVMGGIGYPWVSKEL